MSEKASGDEGYLADKGLIPLPASERPDVVNKATNLVPMGS
jgi:phosphate transport system substrate-binding protein